MFSVYLTRSDEQGSVVAYSDGEELTWNCAPSESWQAGEVRATPTPEQSGSGSDTPGTGTGIIASTGKYAVNNNNGKIHIVGACPATGTGKSAMKDPIYFDNFEEADAYAIQVENRESKKNKDRKCGNCW